MTSDRNHSIPRLLSVLANEVMEVRSMLLRYENAVTESQPDYTVSGKALQDFDLVMQILGDMETSLEMLARIVPLDSPVSAPFATKALKLERMRKLIAEATEDMARTEADQNTTRVEFF